MSFSERAIHEVWIEQRNRLTGRDLQRQLRLDIERHRGHVAQCIHAAWYWRTSKSDIGQESFRAVIAQARAHSRSAQEAIRTLRSLEHQP